MTLGTRLVGGDWKGNSPWGLDGDVDESNTREYYRVLSFLLLSVVNVVDILCLVFFR